MGIESANDKAKRCLHAGFDVYGKGSAGFMLAGLIFWTDHLACSPASSCGRGTRVGAEMILQLVYRR